ncbi:hypothetical protein J6590_011358 [Homalodisca vitripennis]|nr:hypothetical protein J6590_011358 [Homalodisca vitripennis]
MVEFRRLLSSQSKQLGPEKELRGNAVRGDALRGPIACHRPLPHPFPYTIREPPPAFLILASSCFPSSSHTIIVLTAHCIRPARPPLRATIYSHFPLLFLLLYCRHSNFSEIDFNNILNSKTS